MTTTRDQTRAQIAWESASAKDFTAADGTFAKKFPALVMTAGLCQALAFAEAKGHRKYLESLATILGYTNTGQLLTDSREKPVTAYQRLTHEALSAAGWLKRYSEALGKTEDSGNADESTAANEDAGQIQS